MRLRLLSLFGDLRHVPPLGGMRRFGVPRGGPADGESAALAAVLVGSPSTSVVELSFGRATFRVEERGTLAVVGGGRAERFSIAPGETLALTPIGGARLALAAPGGWTCPPLGTDPEASFSLKVGDALDSPPDRDLASQRLYTRPRGEQPLGIRVVAGPQHELWTGILGEFTVAPLLDRRGIRLFGASEHRHEIPSEPCVPGVVQWTPSGELILLGPDGPTIGGYPKPFVVITADLPKLGRLLPGQSTRLREVTPPEARNALDEADRELARRLFLIRLAG